MAKLNFYCILVVLLLSGLGASGQIPKVIHFSKQEYRAQNQNWSIAQGQDLRLYVSNSGGLLQYDGARWRNFSPPNSPVLRRNYCTPDGKVYIGGYATVGYWEAGDQGQFQYHSLVGQIEEAEIAREEIWHFLPTPYGLFFQSFAAVFRYKDGRVEKLKTPGNAMFMREVGGRVLLPVINKGLFEYLSGGEFRKIPGSEILAGKRVATILPFGNEAFLACTEKAGLFLFSGDEIRPWNTPVSARLKASQLNKGIIMENGRFAFGTILNGVFITNKKGEVLLHINQENGLQNNTVLSLFEDRAHNLWAGLDRGIDLIATSSPLSYYPDRDGHIGTVYSARIFKGYLYLGTNQGVFYKPWPSGFDSEFELVENAQGQAWNLQVVDGQLWCAHNTGVFIIRDKVAVPVYSTTGVYQLLPYPQRDDILLLCTYRGMSLLQRNGSGTWQFIRSLDGFSLHAREAAFDGNGMIWAVHPHKGVFCMKVDKSLSRAETIPVSSPENLPPLSALKAKLRKVEGVVYLMMDSLNLHWDEEAKKLVSGLPPDAPDFIQETDKWAKGIGGDWFRIFPSYIELLHQGRRTRLQAHLNPNNENISILDESSYLFFTEEGYALVATSDLEKQDSSYLPGPLISEVIIGNRDANVMEVGVLKQPFYLKASENKLHFFFAAPYFVTNVNMRYRLKGFGEEWSLFRPLYDKEYNNLPPGDYTFEVQSELSQESSSTFSFTIAPNWYQTWWAKLGMVAMVLLIMRGFWEIHLSRLAQQKRRLELEKARELHQQQIRAKNEILQSEIISKSRKLADSTMGLVRKNEMLIRLKKEVKQFKKKKEAKDPTSFLNKLIRQVDTHLSDDEDWKVFESNFNQLHNQFFQRLKAEYPDLTPGDLRLGAYLKMNLSSKEIAPLLNISVRGVENKRYRLRRKMNLSSEVNLTEYLMRY